MIDHKIGRSKNERGSVDVGLRKFEIKKIKKKNLKELNWPFDRHLLINDRGRFEHLLNSP